MLLAVYVADRVGPSCGALPRSLIPVHVAAHYDSDACAAVLAAATPAEVVLFHANAAGRTALQEARFWGHQKTFVAIARAVVNTDLVLSTFDPGTSLSPGTSTATSHDGSSSNQADDLNGIRESLAHAAQDLHDQVAATINALDQRISRLQHTAIIGVPTRTRSATLPMVLIPQQALPPAKAAASDDDATTIWEGAADLDGEQHGTRDDHGTADACTEPRWDAFPDGTAMPMRTRSAPHPRLMKTWVACEAREYHAHAHAARDNGSDDDDDDSVTVDRIISESVHAAPVRVQPLVAVGW